MVNIASYILQGWVGWIEFWDRVATAERVRLASERAASNAQAAHPERGPVPPPGDPEPPTVPPA